MGATRAKGVFDFPETASGLLLTGTSQATVVALSAARVRALGPQVRAQGNGAAYLTAYAGAGVHNAARKGLEVLGIGSDNLRLIPDGANGIDIAHLTQAIATDRAAGATPFAIVGTAGSVDLGHFDDLNALADLAAAQSLWFHIDCAFGAWTRLADAPWRALSDGINRADSLACDFHKWMYVPYDCGMVLIRDEAEHRAAFASRPAYLAAQDTGLGANEPWFCDYGTDLSRGNRALKVWSAIETYGTARLGAAITDNCRMAALMGALASQPPMRLMASVVSNVCVFTANADLPAQAQSALNTHIAHALQLQGIAVFSTTKIDDIICLRAAIANHRTRKDDVITAMNAVRKLALGA